MKATELRIGNLIEFCDELHSINYVDIENLVFDELDDAYKPIQLVGEWLAKFGFKIGRHGDFYIDLFSGASYLSVMFAQGYWYPTIDQNAELSSERNQSVSINRIQYVHQLQNLYFALTGEELTITK